MVASKEQQREMEAYWRSEEWIKMKVDLLMMADHKCERCGKHVKTFVPHHLSYENFKNETYEDIQLLCMHCHQVVHGLVKEKVGKKVKCKQKKREKKRVSTRSPKPARVGGKPTSLDGIKGPARKIDTVIEGIKKCGIPRDLVEAILSKTEAEIKAAWKIIQANLFKQKSNIGGNPVSIASERERIERAKTVKLRKHA